MSGQTKSVNRTHNCTYAVQHCDGPLRAFTLWCFGMLAVFVMPSCCNAREYVTEAFGKKVTVKVTEKMVRQAPAWPDNSDSPPIPPRQALRVAEKLADRLVGNTQGYERKLDDGVCLLPTDGGWVWCIRFAWYPKDAMTTGLPNSIVVIVLMDGTTVQPTVEEIEKEE
jgi:hypothetical protein